MERVMNRADVSALLEKPSWPVAELRDLGRRSQAAAEVARQSEDVNFDSFGPFVVATFVSMGALIFLLHDSPALLPVLLVVCGLSGMAVIIFGRGRRLAQHLLAREADAMHRAFHDGLTALPNRLLFMDRLNHALQQLSRGEGAVAVLALDLDRFKEVNDTFGHQFGDELLREVARRLNETCRNTDTLARLGGDEFAIVQSNASVQSAASLSDRIIRALAEPFDLSAGRVYVGSSIGISLLARSAVDAADGLRQADLALYRAKDGGGGQYCFFKQEMDAAFKTRRAVEMDLREVLAQGGLTMAYQTQVGAKGQVQAVEALVRWTHPVRGPIAPEFFVPIAEECGLIEQLSIFTLRTAFTDARNWPESVKVAINVSPAHLKMRSFLDTIVALLDETGADANRFELEITESLFLGEDPQVQTTLRRLREMGFCLALDDFGTGYSSFSFLRHYPVDKIKIDQSFVAALGADAESDAVVSAIIKLASAMKLAVVAEGVETNDQRKRLSAAGCSDVQGFLFSRPVSALEVACQVDQPTDEYAASEVLRRLTEPRPAAAR